MRLQPNCWPKLQSSEGLTGVGGSMSKMVHSNACWWEASVHYHRYPFTALPGVLMTEQGASYTMSDLRRWKQAGSCNTSYNLACEASLVTSTFILLGGSESLSWATSGGQLGSALWREDQTSCGHTSNHHIGFSLSFSLFHHGNVSDHNAYCYG